MGATIVIIALVIFVAGIIAGVMLMVRVGIQREERDFSLTPEAPDLVSRATRRVTGLYVHDAGYADAAERERTRG